MKRLKNRYPFNGKYYPYIAAVAAACSAVMMPIYLGLEPGLITLAGMILIPAVILLVCYIIEQRLSAEEKALVENTSSPLWYPVDENIRRNLARKYQETQHSPVYIVFVSIVVFVVTMVLGMLPSAKYHRGFSTPAEVLPIAIIFAAAAFFIIYIKKGIGGNWLDIDDTAMYTVVKIHHCFDVHFRNKYGDHYYKYLVFYQPDGRYVLRLTDHDTSQVDSVTIVKFRNSITWVPNIGYTGGTL